MGVIFVWECSIIEHPITFVTSDGYWVLIVVYLFYLFPNYIAHINISRFVKEFNMVEKIFYLNIEGAINT